MAAPHDTDSQQIPSSVAIKKGIAALLTTSAETEQKWYDAYIAEHEEKEEWKSKYEAEKERADKAEAEIEYWKKLAQKPKIIFRDNSSLGNLITGNLEEHYAEDSSIPGQQPLRQLSVG